jgi:hypothetical protein
MILICSLYQLNLYVCIYADNLETRAYTHTDRDTERERERASNPIIIFMKPKFENYDVIYHVKN